MQSIVSLSDFLASPPGRYVLAWEKTHLDRAVADVFGYHAVQLGVPGVDTLAENRMPLRLCVTDRLDLVNSPGVLAGASPAPGSAPALAPASGGRRVAVVTRFEELPFSSQSIDLVVMPHVLEFAEEPHQVLREVDRVLVPDGQVIITGFNPASLWGMRQAMMRLGAGPFLPPASQFISLPRIKDWLKLLSFEASRGRFGCYAPWAGNERWLSRWGFLEKAGDRWWPFLGSVYLLAAVKRVRGMRLIGPAWRRKEERRAALAPAATQRNTDGVTVRIVQPGDAANDAAQDAAHG